MDEKELVEKMYIVPYNTANNSDVKLSAMAPQIIRFMIVYSNVYSGTDKKHQSTALLAFVRGIHR